MNQAASNEDALLAAAQAGDQKALAVLMDNHRPQLERIVALRLDSQLAGRVDPADVVQDTFLAALSKFPEFLKKRSELSFLLWLRLETLQTLVDIHRFHLGAQRRDARKEWTIHKSLPSLSSVSLAAHLVGRFSTASQAAMRLEIRHQVERALDGLEDQDREMLALRHFEELSNSDAARVLGLSKTAACNRYARALRRLRESLERLPGGLEALCL